MGNYLDKTGLSTLWSKIKERDTSTLNAAKNDATDKDTTLKNELNSSINATNLEVSTLKGYFTSGVANKAIADKNGADIAATYIPLTQKGVANGIATLGSDGKVPTSQLPSYVDDVVEYTTKTSFPSAGEAGKIYVAKDTNKTHRWTGTQYVEISASLAIGEVTGSAYDGAKGKANADAIEVLERSLADNYYTRSDSDAKYVDLTSSQTITGQKYIPTLYANMVGQFGSSSKYTFTDDGEAYIWSKDNKIFIHDPELEETNGYTFPHESGTIALTSDIPTALTTAEIDEICV